MEICPPLPFEGNAPIFYGPAVRPDIDPLTTLPATIEGL